MNFVGAHPVGDGMQGKDEGVCHAHRPRGGLLQQHNKRMADKKEAIQHSQGWINKGWVKSPMTPFVY